MAISLTLYTRQGCHLCEQMLQSLVLWQQRRAFTLEIVDIDEDTFLQRRYGEWIPILIAEEHELCHYHLDEQALNDYLDSQSVAQNSFNPS